MCLSCLLLPPFRPPSTSFPLTKRVVPFFLWHPAPSRGHGRSRESSGDHGRSCKVTCGRGEVSLKSRCSCSYKSHDACRIAESPRSTIWTDMPKSRRRFCAIRPTRPNRDPFMSAFDHMSAFWLSVAGHAIRRFDAIWLRLADPALCPSMPPSVPPSHRPSPPSH